MALKALIPNLETNNMDQTLQFYEGVLGFQCINRMENDWARVEKEGVTIMFSSRFFEKQYPKTYLTGGLYIYTDHIDELWEQLKDKVKICYLIETFDYGMREFAIYDNNEYRLQFGEAQSMK